MKCYFCLYSKGHTPFCVRMNSTNEMWYMMGFRAGINKRLMLNTSHPAFFNGWCNGLRSISKPVRVIKK